MDLKFGSIDNVKKFCIKVLANNSTKDYLYVPAPFVNKFRDELTEKVYLHLKNGDVFEALFNPYCRCFVGLAVLFERYHLSYSHFLFFEYWGSSEFGVVITNSKSVEIEYEADSSFYYVSGNPIRTIPMPPAFIQSIDYSLEDEMNCTLLKLSSFDGWEPKFEKLLDDSDVGCAEEGLFIAQDFDWLKKRFIDQKSIIINFQFEERSWEIGFQIMSSGIYLSKGWDVFVRDVCLESGDLCVMQRSGVDHRYIVGVYKDYFHSLQICREAQYLPSIFMKAIDHETLERGQMFVPLFFSKLYFNVLPRQLMLMLGSGASFKVEYDPDLSLMSGTEELMWVASSTNTLIMLFNYIGNGIFKVSMFDTQGVDVFMF